MKKFFYIIRQDSDEFSLVTRCGQRVYAKEFIARMGEGNYIIWNSNESKNEYAMEEFISNQLTAILPITTKEGESQMDKTKLSNGLMLIANGFALCAQAFGGVMAELAKTNEEPKIEAPKEEKAKKTRTTKTKEVVEETKVEEVTTQEDDFSDFEFEAEEEKVKYTVEDIRAACIAHAKKNTKEKTYAILKEFGAKSPNDIKAESYNDVMAKLAV